MFLLRLSWLISLGISLLGFLIIGNLFTIQPDGVSGNGNLGFVGITFVVPFLLLSIFTTFRYFPTISRKTQDRLMKFLSLIGGLLLLAVLMYLSFNFKNDILETLDKTSDNPSFPKLNSYTYSIYFNFYTFALLHTIVGVIALFVGLMNPKTKKEELSE